MSDPTLPTRDLDHFNAPWNKEITLSEAAYDGGMAMLRIRIREKLRFTDLELDPETARRWGQVMLDWAESQPGS